MRRRILTASVWATSLLISSVSAIVPLNNQAAPPLFPNPLFPAGQSPFFVVPGDFNGDGRPDIVAVNNGSSDVSILLGRGDGNFATEVRYAVGDAPRAAVTGDFNGDGRQDLAVTNQDTLDVSILIGNGDGTFQPQKRYAAGDMPAGIATADFDGDHHLDLAVTNATYDGGVSILLGTGTGTFLAPNRFAAGKNPNVIVVGDFNEDSLPDLAVVNFDGSNSFDSDGSILLNLGQGAFAPARRFSVGVHPTSIAAADFDHDGHLDVAVANYGPHGAGGFFQSDVSVLLGNGTGSFERGNAHIGHTVGPWSIATADVNGDSNEDLVVADYDAGQMVIFPGAGNGTFLSSYGVRSGNFTRAVAIADFNADGRPDLAVALSSDAVAAMLNDGSGYFGTRNPSTDIQFASNLTVADLNGDRLPDVIAPRQYNGDISIALSQGPGILGPAHQIPVRENPMAVAAGDFNADGYQDLAVVNATVPGVLSILTGHGDGSFDPMRVVPGALALPRSIAVGDFNRDGVVDLAVAAQNGYVATMLGQGDGNFIAAPARYLGVPLGGLAVGDLNGDGNEDIVVPGPSSTFVLLGLGNGALNPPTSYPTGIGPGSAVIADFNGDGHPDVAQSNPLSGDVSVLPGHGDGTLGVETRLAAGPSFSVYLTIPGAIVAADLNRDGRQDLAVANFYEGDISVFAGRGDGSFRPQTRYLSMAGPIGMAAADFNGDQKPDLAIASYGPGLWLLLNQSVPTGNQPPNADAGPDRTAECSEPGGAQVQLDGSASSDPDSTPGTQDDIVSYEWFEDFGQPTARLLGTGERVEVFFSLGMHHVTLRVTDNAGESDTDALVVTVADTTPPVLSVSSDPALLWPPNHTLVPVQVAWQTADLCDPHPSVVLVSVASSDPDDAPGAGDGQTTMDISAAEPGTADSEIMLRAERDAGGPGRSYSLVYSATDASGNTTQATAVVAVPHDLGSGPEPILLQVSPADSPGLTQLAWPSLSGATGYDVIRGDLQQITPAHNRTLLGTVQVLARGTTQISAIDETTAAPQVGQAFFYLVQPRTQRGGLGYGTESSASPLEPQICDGGCP